MRPLLPAIVKEQMSANENHPLLKIVGIMIQVCQPYQVFVINYSTPLNGGSPIADLLVLLAGGDGISFLKLQKAIEEGCAAFGAITVTLDQPAKVYKELQRGHIFFSWVCRPGNLVYDDGQHSLPAFAQLNAKPIIEHSRFVFEIGYQRAKAFMDGARYYLAFKDNRMVAFMLSQATVQALTAFLTALTGYSHFTHKVIRLFHFTRRITDEFFRILPTHAEEETQLLFLLQSAYSRVPYSDRFTITDDEAVELFALVLKVLATGESEFEESIYYIEYLFASHNLDSVSHPIDSPS